MRAPSIAMIPILNVACSGSLFALVLSFLSSSQALPQSVFDVYIDNDPAPSPEKGPPLSASALRDKGYLPIQIGSIFAAYFLVVIFISIALLTVGRRLRSSALTSPKTLAVEIFKPNPSGFIVRPGGAVSMDNTPVSPSKSKLGWGSFRRHRKGDSANGSVLTFDDSIVEEDRSKNEIEMDRLYAAVAEHESRKSANQSSVSVSELPRSPVAQRPPELQHLRANPQRSQFPQQPQYAQQSQYVEPQFSQEQQYPDQQQYPQQPHYLQQQQYSQQQQFPRDQQYPREQPWPREQQYPLSPSFPLSPPPEPDQVPSRQSTTSPRRQHRPAPIATVSNPPSRNSSRSSHASATSFSKKRGINVRALPISPPMGSADLRPDTHAQYSESEPLSPRVYTPGPPPPTPPQRREQLSRDLRIDTLRAEAEAAKHYRPQQQQPTPQQQQYLQQPLGSPTHFDPSLRGSRASSAGDSLRSLSLASPRTATFAPPAIVEEPASAATSPVSAGGTRAPRAKPAPLALGGGPSAGSSQTTLPLRGAAPLPLRALRSPNSLRPPSMIKATELERPERRNGPSTGRPLRTPLTGVPATPYSPYMPQTPLTPMTPSRLVSRGERKRREKEEGRRVLTAADIVPEEGDMFGDAY